MRLERALLSLALLAVAAPLAAVECPPVPAVPQLLPRKQEVALALSAAPPHLREGAGVWALEAHGFVEVRPSTNGFTCIVNRDHPLNRKPTCYDAEGAATILPKVLREGELLMKGTPVSEIRAEIEAGFASGKYLSPRRPGVAYMLSTGIRNYDPRTCRVGTFPPHVMFYAPNLTNQDIGSDGTGHDGMPFIAYPGPQAFMIMFPGVPHWPSRPEPKQPGGNPAHP